MPPASGPMTVVSASAAWRRPWALGSSRSLTRFGSPAYTAAGRSRWRSPRHPPGRRSARAAGERQRQEDHEADDVGRDHDAAPRKAVDERAGESGRWRSRARSRRSGGRPPTSGLGAVPDVDGERDEREPRSDPRAERGQKEQAEATDSAEQVRLPPDQAVHHSREHAEHGAAEVSTSQGEACRLEMSLPRYTQTAMSVSARPAAAGSRFGPCWSTPTPSSG